MSIKIKRSNYSYLFFCFLIAAWLCIAQVRGSSLLILTGLGSFLVLAAVSAYKGFASPLLLFFLPWSTLLKIAPGSFSFYTFALLIVCAVRLVCRRFTVNIYCILMAAVIFCLSILSKLLDSSAASNSYILFLFLLCLFPVVAAELRGQVNFKNMTIYFALGIIAAALSAQQLVTYPQIARYIDVYSWKTITRLSGYYGDANFYSAHISAALSGILLLLLRAQKGAQRNFLMLLAVVLIYCGFLAASKSFILSIGCVAVMWLCRILSAREKFSRKLLVLLSVVAVICLAIATGIFDEQWEVISTRFQQVDSFSDFTTGRSEVWLQYSMALLEDAKLLLLGKGFTNTVLIEKSTHNTIIQCIYQLGILGSFFMVAWECFFIRGILREHRIKIDFWDAAILLTGIFLVWLSLDMMFFDEFFLMPLYALAGIIYFGKKQYEQRI